MTIIINSVIKTNIRTRSDCRSMTRADEVAACCPVYINTHAWILTDIVLIQPYRIKGALSLFNTTLPLSLRTIQGELFEEHWFFKEYFS